MQLSTGIDFSVMADAMALKGPKATPAILIDANIYLSFWKTNELARLAPVLSELVSHVFLSQQLANEVTRCKLDVAADFLEAEIKAVKALKRRAVVVPFFAHLEDEDLKAHNVAGRESETAHKKLVERMQAFANRTLLDISRNEDIVSLALAPLFAKPSQPTPPQLERARMRKELGDPPGKRQDPLGDQITWEQFLDASQGQPVVWIVSNDGDYIREVNDVCLLNTRLQADLRTVGGGPRDVRCFNELLPALRDIAKARGMELNLGLKQHELRAISKEQATREWFRLDAEQRLGQFSGAELYRMWVISRQLREAGAQGAPASTLDLADLYTLASQDMAAPWMPDEREDESDHEPEPDYDGPESDHEPDYDGPEGDDGEPDGDEPFDDEPEPEAEG